jgi:hypothetical protein
VKVTVNVQVEEGVKALGQLLVCAKSGPTSEIKDMLTFAGPPLTTVKLFWLAAPINWSVLKYKVPRLDEENGPEGPMISP